ncbi:MAG: RNA helicase, partial [Chloroflexi bacterium]|nr:RNA helicase [Chloroflexota bacterium]
MLRLHQLHRDALVRGIRGDGPVTIVDIQRYGEQAAEVIFKDRSGQVHTQLLFQEHEAELELVTGGQPWRFDADGGLLRLVSEANRVRLAHLFDPYLAVHTSQVEPLPHQISAVYEIMLRRQPLRFLLADDPGAGKT